MNPEAKKRGRKKEFPDGQSFNIILDEATRLKARKIGGGFISKGLRLAVVMYKEAP